MKLPVLLATALLALAPALRAADDYEPRTFTDGAESLPYRLMKPLNFDAAKKYPLVLLLHGAGERGNDNKAQLKWGPPDFAKPAVRESYPAFVLVPQCPVNKKWVEMDWGGADGTAPADPGPTQKLLLGALESVQKEFPIDSDRLYVTGLSMGGYGTWDLITRYPDRFACAVPICGGGDKSKAASAKPVPVWAFHGDADPTVMPVRTTSMVENLKAAGGQVALTLYAGVAHNSWSAAYSEPNLLPWMFAQRRGQPAQKMDLAVSRFTVLAMPPADVFAGAGPLQTGDWFKKLWMSRRIAFEMNTANDKGAVVFFGDSITQGWLSLAKDFPNLKVANRGIAGDTSRGLRYRLRDDVLDLNPRAVSLLIGTNDLSLGGEPEQTIDNIRAIVAELQKQNPNIPIILNRVMPRGPKPGLFPDKIKKLNALIDALVQKDPRLQLCDSWTIFDDGTGACKKEEFPDMLHPNATGYAKWKAALTEVFAKVKM